MRSLHHPKSARSKSLSCAVRPVLMSKLENRLLFAFTVSNLSDGGPGSLRAAIESANTTAGADIVNFQAGLSGTITLTSGELLVSDSAGVDIQGPGSGVISVSGNDATRVLEISAGAAANVSGLTLTHGFDFHEGGILFNRGTANLSNCDISHGKTDENGVGINNGGVMTITDCAIHDNLGLGQVGGGIFNGGTLTVLRSTISNNQGVFGAGISNFGQLTVTASTISGNRGDGLRSQSQGSGTYRMIVRDSTIIDNWHAGVFGLTEGDSRIVLLNSTIARNETGIKAGNSGGFNPPPPSTDAWMTAVNCTVTQNETGVSVFSTAYTELANTIVAGNTTTDVDGSFTDIGHNFIGGDPMLVGPGFYGGPTQTYKPQSTSPVIDAGNNILARYYGPDGIIGTGDDQPLTNDQRGAGFARSSGARVDIGSFEVQFAFAMAVTDSSGVTNLLVRGTDDGDVIAVARSAVGNQLNVTANSVFLGSFAFSGQLIVDGFDGDDLITVDAQPSRGAMLFGGNGADSITTGNGNDVIVGGDGADQISAGNGNDILIGGAGEDQLDGSNGEDVLVAGRTSYDTADSTSSTALRALADAWTGPGNYNTRVNLLSSGVGPGGIYKLNASTVFDDGAHDALSGGNGSDWFVGNFSGAGTLDTTDSVAKEILTDI